MNRFAFLFVMFAAAAHGPALGQAPAWPQKPVRVLVGLAPGGNPDTLARMLASKWGDVFGQQFVVENRPGAGSTIAADLTAKAAPDGYTVLISDSSVITTAPHLYKTLPYDPFRDLQAVSLAVVVPMWLVVHPSVPANSIQELVALAKSRKEPMPYASSGNGSIHHITMELFKADTGVSFTHVPFKGAGQSVPAMIAGDVKLGFIGYPAAAGAIKTGRLRVLAFSMAKRSTLTPEIQTVAETVAPGFDMSAPLGVFVAARTPHELVARLSRAVNAAVRSPDLLERMAAIGMEPAGTTPEQYEKLLREEYARFGSLIRRIGMRLD
ncbi:MAG: tripartite tricarboxylate transporter substrate binding protein [Betaproteobacteria bacterium]|nr:MAG: tripartite tricarboxylate transporter substrate binding protein [Betaproteobacteria bacterium]TMH78026.1 MAG: tripartite tricarboxylate transporter substrate binding protein [Betaproteobacteria bacterium]